MGQSVSINLGKNSSKHKILKIGDRLVYNEIQIWDLLTKKN